MCLIFCSFIACDVGLVFIANFVLFLSVEADGVKKRPVALLLKLLYELVNFVLHVVSVLDLERDAQNLA